MKDTVLFDFDGTLVDHDKTKIYEKVICNTFGREDAALAAKLAETERALNLRGVYDRQFVFGYHRDHFPSHSNKTLAEEYWRAFSSTQWVKPKAHKVLNTLQRKGYRLVCVTDTDGTDGDKRKRLADSGLMDYFAAKDIIIGSERGWVPKGNNRFLPRVLRKLKVTADLCVMVGDKVEVDINPAELLGIPSILIHNKHYPGKWPMKLRSLIDLPKHIERIDKRVFLSYCHQDKTFVDRLDLKLQQAGFMPWRDIRDVLPGDAINERIRNAIRQHTVFLIVISNASSQSEWVRHELVIAQEQHIKQRNIIIPVLVEGDLPSTFDLGRECYADFRKGFDDELERVVKQLRAHCRTPIRDLL